MTTTINLPMDVAREIAKYNDQTQEIEKLKEALAEEKTKTDKYAEYLFTVLDGESQRETHFCDVCGFQCSWYHSTSCDRDGCGKDLDPNGDYHPGLTVCDGCTDEYFADLGVDYEPMCLDCYNGETKIPRIRRLTDAYERRRAKERKKILEREIKILKRVIPTCSKDQTSHFIAKRKMRWYDYGIRFCAPLRERESWEGKRENPKDY